MTESSQNVSKDDWDRLFLTYFVTSLSAQIRACIINSTTIRDEGFSLPTHLHVTEDTYVVFWGSANFMVKIVITSEFGKI